MPSSEFIQRVRIYLSERDVSGGQTLYLAVLDRLRREGATGATALRGVAGFGAGTRAISNNLSDLTRTPPVVIEWVDRAERVARLLPLLDELLVEALVTVEEVQIYRAVLRSSGPFGERMVGEVLERDVATATPDTSLAALALLMAEHTQPLVPVVDQAGALQGLLTEAVLEQRGLPPLRLLRALPEEERRAALAGLPETPISTLMQAETRAISSESPIPTAARTLVEWGLVALPVVAPGGAFAGLFGTAQVLAAALAARPSEGNIRNADPPAPVRLLMQGAVPSIAASARAQEAVELLLASAERFLVVLEEGRPVGVLEDAQLVRGSSGQQRADWLAALTRPAQRPATWLEGLRATDLPLAPARTIGPADPREQAIRALLDDQLERLLVVDEGNRLIGLISRRGLLRALAQESAG
ncbi:MAG: DUF190 domain-containing protein [Roseiflexaceae bacterium]